MVIYAARDGVALVFDDGPNPVVTPQILTVLADKSVKANFFLIGKRAEESPELVKQIFDAGHEIGNHTYTHKRLGKMLHEQGGAAVLEEINKATASIQNIIGVKPAFLRPPYLDWDESLLPLVEPLYGDRIILSDTKTGDYAWGQDHVWDKDDAAAIAAHTKRIVGDWADSPAGTIMGLHDSAEYNLPGNSSYDTWMYRALPTLAALPTIIDALHQKGLTFKKLSEMDLLAVPWIARDDPRTKQ